MKLLIYSINYAPELTGIGKYTGEMAAWFRSQGHEVRVVTAPPYYPEWKVGYGYSSWRYKHEEISAVRIWRAPLWVPARLSGLKRIIHLASFAVFSTPLMLRQIFWKPDLVFVVEPPLFCAPVSWFVAKISGAKCWLHVQDFEVDAAFSLGIIPFAWMRRFVVGVEKRVMGLFSKVSTISPNMLARLADKGVPSEKRALFPNWVDTQVIYPMDKPASMRSQLAIEADAIVALYSGNMGEKQGLEVVLEAAQELSEHGEIVFLLCGDGAARERLQKQYSNLPNVQWLPLQPAEKLNDLLNCADIHLLPQRGDASDLVMPSKLTGMLASGRPVIATAHEGTQLADVVSKCGIVVPPDDAEGVVQAVLQLIADKEMRMQLGESARQYAETHMGKDSLLAACERSIKELAHG